LFNTNRGKKQGRAFIEIRDQTPAPTCYGLRITGIRSPFAEINERWYFSRIKNKAVNFKTLFLLPGSSILVTTGNISAEKLAEARREAQVNIIKMNMDAQVMVQQELADMIRDIQPPGKPRQYNGIAFWDSHSA
jgi:hypothetical protein